MASIDIFSRPVASHRPRVGVSLWTRLSLWRSRRDLARLDTEALRDIGVSPEAAAREANKGIWDVPATWKDN